MSKSLDRRTKLQFVKIVLKCFEKFCRVASKTKQLCGLLSVHSRHLLAMGSSNCFLHFPFPRPAVLLYEARFARLLVAILALHVLKQKFLSEVGKIWHESVSSSNDW